MLRNLAACILVLCVAAPAFGESGYVHGKDHCYHFTAPLGWKLDNKSGAGDGVPMVFYPTGSNWQTGETVMYTRVASFKAGHVRREQRVRSQVDAVLELYRQASPPTHLTARKVQTLRGVNGEAGELWTFTGYSNGGKEHVAYFVGRESVNFFVMQDMGTGPNAAGPAKLVELATSYREERTCVPCNDRLACAGRN